MPAAARFERPRTLREATAVLAEGGFVPLAGGTDLYAAHVGRPVTAPLVDLTAVEGLRGIRRETDETGAAHWVIGATTTWTDIVRAELPPLFDGLKAAAREVGGVQVQNTGTVAGNLCNASPAADGVPALLALDAEVVLASANGGERRVALADFIVGPRRTVRRDDELVVAIRLPARSARARSAFVKLGARRHLVISIAMVAVTIDVDDLDRIAFASVAVGSCSAVAQRLPALESRLSGTPRAAIGEIEIDAADLAPLHPIDDVRGSAGYRLDAVPTLVRRVLLKLSS